MLMRATGRGSISSFLKLAVDVAWVLACALLGFIWIIVGISFLASVTGIESLGGFKSVVIRDPFVAAVGAFNGTVLCGAAMIICAYLRGIFETLIAGDAFVEANALRMRNIALVLAVVELVHMGGRMIAPLLYGVPATSTNESSGNDTFDLSSWFGPLIIWFAVLTLLVLAQVFREGAALREEQKMTI